MAGLLSRNSLEHAVAGSAGTVLATFLLFPLERVKTLLQVGPSGQAGIREVFLRVLREEGASGLYRGCTPMLQTVGASNFLYFFLFEGLKEPLSVAAGQPEGEIGPYETLISSALAGSLNMVVTEPLWRACVVAQGASQGASSSTSGVEASPQVRRLRGVFSTVCRMWAQEGPRALWRGLGSSLWLVTNPVIQFFAYDLLKASRLNPADVSTLEAFVMGAIAKALATVATFPLQVAQSRLRAVRGAGGGKAPLPPELQGMIPCLRHVAREGGFSALYAGLLPKLLQSVTQAALMFALYEKIHWAIRRAARKTLRRLWRRSFHKLKYS